MVNDAQEHWNAVKADVLDILDKWLKAFKKDIVAELSEEIRNLDNSIERYNIDREATQAITAYVGLKIEDLGTHIMRELDRTELRLIKKVEEARHVE